MFIRFTLLAFVTTAYFACPAAAQAGPWFNNTPTVLNGTTTCNGGETSLTISVDDAFNVTDLNVGIVADHTWRRDIRLTLVSPSNTSVQLSIAPANGPGVDDINALFDDSETLAITNDTAAHDADAPRYQFNRRPDILLSAFNGEPAFGDWTLDMCDAFPGADNGEVTFFQLAFNNQPILNADLSLSANTATPAPNYGDTVTMTLNVANAGPDAATDVDISAALPNGLSYVSHSGPGTYTPATGLWSLPGSLANGGQQTLTVLATVQTNGLYNWQSEITGSGALDPDSTPGNRAQTPFEDDTASLQLSPTSTGGATGVPPTLNCSAPLQAFDWDAASNAWPINTNTAATSETRTYPGGGSDGLDASFTWGGAYNRRINVDGSLTPRTSPYVSGGLTPAQQGLLFGSNMNSRSEIVTLTIDLGVTGLGVKGAQFALYDIDLTNGQFTDQVIINGSLGGVAVGKVLTNSANNSVSGSTAIGVTATGETSAAANLYATFQQPIDRITITYGNGASAPANPGAQWMKMSDISYCPRETDFGDAQGYGSPRHAIAPAMFIGAVPPDGETAAQPSPAADGDDLAGTQDEAAPDLSALFIGLSGSVDVEVTGSSGFLQGWIDWNGNGSFADTVDGVSEQIAVDVAGLGTSTTLSLPITVPASATTAPTVMRLRWSTQAGLGPTGAAQDGEVEDYLVTLVTPAQLSAVKAMSLFDPNADGLYALPGNDVIYTFTVTNNGGSAADSGTLFLVDAMPGEIEYFNGDIDAGGPDVWTGTDPVGFDAGTSGLSLTYNTDPAASDVTFSNNAAKPTDPSECAYSPLTGYDPAVTFICFAPRGAMAGGTPAPSFSIAFRGRIK